MFIMSKTFDHLMNISSVKGWIAWQWTYLIICLLLVLLIGIVGWMIYTQKVFEKKNFKEKSVITHQRSLKSVPSRTIRHITSQKSLSKQRKLLSKSRKKSSNKVRTSFLDGIHQRERDRALNIKFGYKHK